MTLSVQEAKEYFEGKPKYKLALCVLAVLTETFPRRKFAVDVNHTGTVVSEVEPSPLTYFIAKQHIAIKLDGRVYKVSLNQLATSAADLYEAVSELRTTFRKQREQMNKHIKRLKATELLCGDNLEFIVSDMPLTIYTAPRIKVFYQDIPDTPIAEIVYNGYARKRSETSYTVLFGQFKSFYCTSLKELLEVFDSDMVFKANDNDVPEDAYKILLPKSSNERSSRVVCKLKDLQMLAPYLLMMQSTNMKIVDVTVSTKTTFSDMQDDGFGFHTREATCELFRKSWTEKALLCDAFVELDPGRFYADSAQPRSLPINWV